jgi:hypothetical protein
LSFSSAYSQLARRFANDLDAANIEVVYDQWEGGGGVPATQSVSNSGNGVAFVVALLTPSGATGTWIGDEWRRAIYDEARIKGVPVLPIRRRAIASLRISSSTLALPTSPGKTTP